LPSFPDHCTLYSSSLSFNLYFNHFLCFFLLEALGVVWKVKTEPFFQCTKDLSASGFFFHFLSMRKLIKMHSKIAQSCVANNFKLNVSRKIRLRVFGRI
jgi:hypothetical protein